MRAAVGGNHGSSSLRFHRHWAITGLGAPAWEINSLGDRSNAVPYMSPAPAPKIPDDEVGEIVRDAIEDQHII
eukprot:1433976-Ditylum_brightwellii.AAC.1